MVSGSGLHFLLVLHSTRTTESCWSILTVNATCSLPSSSIPPSSGYKHPIEMMQKAQDFMSSELASCYITSKLEEWNQGVDWVDKSDSVYFELIGDVSHAFRDVSCICSKMYSSYGVVFITIYFEGVFYTTIHDGDDEQPLLDVKFPDVSEDGEGLTLALYDENEMKTSVIWHKLSLWQLLPKEIGAPLVPVVQEPRTRDLSATVYTQTYCVLKRRQTNKPPEFREVLFRFGSWCYSGTVELIPELSIADIPHVIPALRLQQSRLNFLCDVSQLPNKGPFTAPLQYATDTHSIMEGEITSIENVLSDMKARYKSMGQGDGIDSCFDGDPTDIFFEFTNARDDGSASVLDGVELIATKCYNPSGVVAVSLYFDCKNYLSIQDGSGEQPLLDSKFPSVIQGRGYQIKTYPAGTHYWPQLRRLSIWKNAESIMKEQTMPSNKAKEAKLAVDMKEQTSSTLLCSERKNGQSDSGRDSDEDGGCKYISDEVMKGRVKEKARTMTAPGKKEGYGSILSTENINTYADTKKNCITEQGYNRTKHSERVGSKELASLKATPGRKKDCKHNFGAFHHLAPLKMASQLEGQVEELKHSMPASGNSFSAPWDSQGSPLNMDE